MKQAANRAMRLRAGPVSLRFDLETGFLRYICCGDTELLRGIYCAVRDRNWGTVPGVLSDLESEIGEREFRLSFVSRHRQGEIDFSWSGEIRGTADGTVAFTMQGEAHSEFERNRIGFCVLHPADCAGLSCEVERVDGSLERGAFPTRISPHQPFTGISAVRHEPASGLRVEVRMDGEVFEMEDQRNWTDASYKTYCTPLDRPFPVKVEAGSKISQSVTLRLQGNVQAMSRGREPAALHLTPDRQAVLPKVGLGAASHGRPLSPFEADRLRNLRPAHLRFDLSPNGEPHADALRRAASEAQALDAGLELALHLGDEPEEELRRLRGLCDELSPPVARWLVFHQEERSTSERWLRLARRILGGTAPFAAGTDAFFTEINRDPPPAGACDQLVYSINPQMHAFDDASLVETLPVQMITVVNALALSTGKPVVVSPVTLRMRHNPNATAAGATGPLSDRLPPQVDPRQPSLLAAGWTLGSLKYLALGGAHSVTFYETTGWRGVMEQESGPELPERFPSVPGGVFPLYHVLADVQEFAGGSVLGAATSRPRAVEVLALAQGARRRVLVANLCAEEQNVRLHGLTGSFGLRTLDETTVKQATEDPGAFRESTEPLSGPSSAGFTLTLRPHAVATLDGAV